MLALAVGFFSAGIGVGGGAIMVPTLVWLFRFEFRQAAGTSLAIIIPISLIGALSHIFLFRHALNLQLLLIFVPATVLGALLGGFFLLNFKTRYLKLAFAIFIMIAGMRMLGIFDVSFQLFDALKGASPDGNFILIILFGLVTGFISTMLGVGCGLIIVPFFVILIGLGMHEAITLSLTTMFFLTSTATLVHRKYRAFDWTSAKQMLLPAIAGAATGALISSRLPAAVLKKAFGIFLLAMALKFILEEAGFAYSKLRWGVQDDYERMR